MTPEEEAAERFERDVRYTFRKHPWGCWGAVVFMVLYCLVSILAGGITLAQLLGWWGK
jgi:hypothetical protein